MAKKRTHQELRIFDKIFGADLFLESKENTEIVARNMNILALLICFSHSTYLLLAGIMTMTFLGIFTCYLPTLLCIVTEILFRNERPYAAMLFTFTLVPIAITMKGMYEPLPGLMLFPITYGLVSIFLMSTGKLIYLTYTLSATCFTITDVAYHYKFNPLFKENVSLILFNDVMFAFLIYTVLGYLRNLLTKFGDQRKIKEREIVSQNLKLQIHQEEIANQNLLLQQRNQLVIESWHFQQKITSVLSHDTRTSLIFLKHIVESSKRMNENNPDTKELLSDLDREISNMTGTFENVLQWLKQPSYNNNINKEEILLNDIAEEVMYLYKGQAKNKEILLVNDVSSSYKLYINREYLRTILRNIISNAIKFSKKGGYVKVWAEETTKFSRIYIMDNGVGITASNLKKINDGVGFSTSGTLWETGTGMGLVFCRDFIKKSDGIMDTVSSPDQGTTITISLPLFTNKTATPTSVEIGNHSPENKYQ